MEKQQISGYFMAGAGFVMILINALSYLLGWELKSPAFTIIGLVLIVLGARTAGRSTWV
jgi:hypothetical protein